MRNSLCPHCGADAAVPIVYGMPGPEAMEAAERQEAVLAGCVVSGDDASAACTQCGSTWASSEDVSVSEIDRKFVEYFANWDIHLPPGAEAAMRRGSIHKAGWAINYIFGDDEERYVEFYASHRMTNDRRHRIYASGRVETLDAIQEMYMYDPKVAGSEEQSKRKYLEDNQRIAEELRQLGLYPEGSINAFLRTNDVPRPRQTRVAERDLHRRLAQAVDGLRHAFDPNDLAYLSLTSKPEFVIRDRIAIRLHTELWPRSQVAREWRPAAKGSWRSDLAVLNPENGEPLLLLEAKAMYTFDAIKKSREQYPLLVEQDISKSFHYASTSTLVYGLLIAVHPKTAIPKEAIPAVKYAAQVNASLRRREQDALRREAIAYLDQRLRRIGPLTSKGSIPAGQAFGVHADLLCWLIGPIPLPSLEQTRLDSRTELFGDLEPGDDPT